VFAANNDLRGEKFAAHIDTGRSRWKIKSEHNVGHGKENLAAFLF